MIAVYIQPRSRAKQEAGREVLYYVRTSDKSREKHSHRSDKLGNHFDEESLPYNLKVSPLPHCSVSVTNILSSKNSSPAVFR